VARFVYIDETGSDGTATNRQPFLMLVAAIVDESMVRPLSEGLHDVAEKHLGWPVPKDLEFHGYEIWQGMGRWAGKTPDERIAAYEDALALLDACDITVAFSSIDKAKLHANYGGAADGNAYVLALQFLLEKIDMNLGSSLKVLVADELKEQQLRAVKMVADLQTWAHGGVVPGKKLKTIIDSLHYVSSHASPGVQMADLIAYVLQRWRTPEKHPNAQAALDRFGQMVRDHTRTYRSPWPS
jgi:hypothetical protein